MSMKTELAALKKQRDAGEITAFKFRQGTRKIKNKYGVDAPSNVVKILRPKASSTNKPDPDKLANPKPKGSDSRYRPGKGGVGDARYRPGAGSVASQLVQSGMKVTKKPNNTSNASASKKPEKKDAPPVSMPKSRPKTKRNATNYGLGKKKNNNATNYGLGKMKKDPPKGPGVGKQDKEDKRKNFKSKPVKNAALPAGAKPFKGGYDSKTHKLQNIRGKTYVVPKPKAKKK